jgi:membrane-bound lytic murein transglycosylase D
VDDLTFPPADAALTARLQSELNTTSDLPLVINDTVAGYINAYANSSSFKAHMRKSLERAGRFRAFIQQVLKEEGVPQDLIYLAVAESGFQLQVVNARSGAGGMWQFMPTGAYGLQRNGYFDERFDPEKSTRAYARYIKGLYNQFGDWNLAMAAYDWGPGNVQRAVMRTGYADYWELYRRNALPRETKNYVPQILAAAIMAKNPARYGLEGVISDAPVVNDTVGVDYAMDLRLAADVTGTTLANIVAINPALLRLSTPAGIHYDMHLPEGTKAEFEQRIAAIPVEKRSSWRFHEVRAGETLETVSQLFHVSSTEIRVANDLSDADPVGEGDELVVPVQNAGQPSTRPLQYTARSGDTLVTVADRFNVSTEELREWNHLGSGEVGQGDVLYVSEPVRLPPAGRGHVRGRGRSYGAVRRGRGSARHGGARGAVRSGPASRRSGAVRGGAVRGSAHRGAARGGAARGGVTGRGGAASGKRSVAHASSAKRKRR